MFRKCHLRVRVQPEERGAEALLLQPVEVSLHLRLSIPGKYCSIFYALFLVGLTCPCVFNLLAKTTD